jgi:hypothetical protein
MSGRCYPPGQATCVRYPVSAPLELCPLTKLVRPRGFYRPDGLLEGLAPHLADPTAGIVDLHMYTFNAVEGFESWRRAYLTKLGAAVAAA